MKKQTERVQKIRLEMKAEKAAGRWEYWSDGSFFVFFQGKMRLMKEHKNTPCGCALARREIMSQATAPGARMCVDISGCIGQRRQKKEARETECKLYVFNGLTFKSQRFIIAKVA